MMFCCNFFTPSPYRSPLIKYFLSLLLFCLSSYAQAQFWNFPILPENPKAPSAMVRLENRDLFRVYGASPQAVQDRAELVQYRLTETLKELPNRPLPEVNVSTEEENPVVRINGEPLVTVTAADVEGYGRDALPLAQGWAKQVENAFVKAIEERRPEFLRQAAQRAGGVALFGMVLHLILWVLFRRFLDRPGWPIQIFLWLGILLYLLDLFPQTRHYYNLLTAGVLRPFMIIVMVALGAMGIARLWSVLLAHLFPPLPDHLTGEERAERSLLRRMTLIYVTRVTGITVIWFMAFIVGLTWAGVNLPALLASAGLIGVALGLAAQDTMRDIVAGVNVLLDDRYGVGDTIRVGEYSGEVERFNLRVTQIRDLSGRYITLPNRTIEQVANLTASWSQVDFKVRVSYQCDLRRAMEIVEETAHLLAEDWPGRVLAPPKMLGVDDYTASNIVLRLTLRTTPGDQWAVDRELHLRVKEALEHAGFPPPIPHQRISFMDAADLPGRENGPGDGDGSGEPHAQPGERSSHSK